MFICINTTDLTLSIPLLLSKINIWQSVCQIFQFFKFFPAHVLAHQRLLYTAASYEPIYYCFSR